MGAIVQSFATTEQGVSESVDIIHTEGPGTSCRGNLVFGPEG